MCNQIRKTYVVFSFKEKKRKETTNLLAIQVLTVNSKLKKKKD